MKLKCDAAGKLMEQKNSKLNNVKHARHTGRLIQNKHIQHLKDP